MIRYSSDLESMSIANLEELRDKLLAELAETDEVWEPDYALFLKKNRAIVCAWLDMRLAERELSFAKQHLKDSAEGFDATIVFREQVYRKKAQG